MTLKSNAPIPLEYIQTVISHHLDGTITALEPVEGGNFSSAFSFRIGERDYIIRFNSSEEAYEHEVYLSSLLHPQGVPYLQVFGKGRKDGFTYCITQRAAGKIVANLKPEQKSALLPDLIRVIATMNQVDLRGASGYGFLGKDNNGQFASWEAFVRSFFSEEQTGTFWEGWYRYFHTTCLEKDVFDECYARLLEHCRYNAPHRHFVHHDCHAWNILSDGQSITGIIDGNCIYGDFLIDIATIESAFPGIDLAERFRLHYERIGFEVPDFQERLTGARYFKGIDGMRFYAMMGWEDAYKQLRDRLLAL
ncbi:aminoglycoside phosphotransferase family protein [Paenibacillus sp. H1-7]|uniref:phosphotransferase family protein n=1 Tax=Paenibacillus sp. H1-7 TaxID=2282849 RepID=UPI001EF83D96|nr:aminoglycoside phosphotransferase family protein [Paenibacillus sp. H1-7]